MVIMQYGINKYTPINKDQSYENQQQLENASSLLNIKYVYTQ